MTIATLAHGARQSLARGLEALQAVDAPRALLDVAQPAARAMGVLVELEKAPHGLVASSVDPALEALREGLRLLQLPEHVEHPAAARSMAAIAETLGVVIELARELEAQPVASAAFTRTLQPGPMLVQPPAPPRAPAPEKPPEPKVVIGGAAAAGILRRQISRDPDLRVIEAPLGTNSPSNFYSGLAGGDVVLSGGLFVATYQVPEVGEAVLLEIGLPGGYEFLAKAIVGWTRSAAEAPTGLHSGGGSAEPPGFGARFTELTEEGRALIRRYVRNREPLFHDDL
jgi:hypothetical protein